MRKLAKNLKILRKAKNSSKIPFDDFFQQNFENVKIFVKVCLHSNREMQMSLQFDDFLLAKMLKFY